MPRRRVMEYVVAAFRSRASVVAFYEYLRSRRVNAEIINTPKEAGVGCGLSVKFSPRIFAYVKNAVFSSGIKNFAGFFLVKTVAGRRFVKSI